MNTQKEKLVTIAFRIPKTLKDSLIKQADRNYRSTSSEAKMLILEGVKQLYKEENIEMTWFK